MNGSEVLRLAGVELFKFFTTRATLWLAVGSLAVSTIVVLATGLYLVSTDGTLSVGAALALATVPVGLFVPVASILVFTSDWQSGEMATYLALVRNRGSMFLAKLITSATVAAGILVSLVVAGFGVTGAIALATGSTASWAAAEPIMNLAAAVGIGSICGAALGALLLSAPLAIALSIVQTLLLDPALGLLPNGVGSYFRVSAITGDWASLPSPLAIVTSALLWIVVPLTIGAFRFHRREP